MKLVTYLSQQGARPGILHEDTVFDLGNTGAKSLLELLEAGEPTSLFDQAIDRNASQPLSETRLLAPLQRPPRIFGIGLNYADHATESKMAVQSVPTVFMKLPSSVTGPGSDIILPKVSTQPDYEAELGVVIGKAGYQVPADAWQEYVFGYTIVNDVSARDVQLATSQWTLGKSFPTFTPIGPALVTKDEVPDPHALDISLTIDGEVLQHSNTRNLIFRIPQIIEYISRNTPLEVGDIISTGTPEGVGLGRKPQRWLKPGEEIAITIEKLGVLRNRTRAEE